MRRSALFLAAFLVVTGLVQTGAAMPIGKFVAPMDPEVATAVGRVSALVHVSEGTSWQAGLQAARVAGADIGTPYKVIKVFVAYGTASTFQRLARSGATSFIEYNAPLEVLTDTAHKATRGQNVLDGAVLAPDGSIIDGHGVGVAVVDSGVDGTHPDLASRMGGNVRIYCSTPQAAGNATLPFTECRGPKQVVPVADSDTPGAGGHGTHVAGIVAGTGSASGGKYHGAAPGATLYGVGVGTTLVVENGLDGLAWVLANHDQVTPAIKVVSNSWGSGYSKYNPSGTPLHRATWLLEEALVQEGVTVVFAAGNSGGDGTTASTGAQCVDPTPGIICVANYDDGNSGTRAGALSSTSSRGKTTDPESWPDISAPGTEIVSTCHVTLPVCWAHTGQGGGQITDPPNSYAILSGTSMAAPAISGIVAQLYQVDPTLTPAQVENLLEDTAYKFNFGGPYTNDPFNTDNTSSFDKGHGLVDVLAAVNSLLGLGSGTPAKQALAISPTFGQQNVFFTCAGGDAQKVQNSDTPAGWSTSAPSRSYTTGAGCGALDLGSQQNSSPDGGSSDAAFRGIGVGNIRNATVELWVLGHTNYSALLDANLSVRLTIDGKSYVAKGTRLVDVPWQESASGASRKVEFTITNIGSFTEATDANGQHIGVFPTGVAAEDGNGIAEHDVHLTVGMWFADENGAWVWGATEIASGITFNDATPAAKTLTASPEE
jgi:serine protease AprX